MEDLYQCLTKVKSARQEKQDKPVKINTKAVVLKCLEVEIVHPNYSWR